MSNDNDPNKMNSPAKGIIIDFLSVKKLRHSLDIISKQKIQYILFAFLYGVNSEAQVIDYPPGEELLLVYYFDTHSLEFHLDETGIRGWGGEGYPIPPKRYLCNIPWSEVIGVGYRTSSNSQFIYHSFNEEHN